jgi:hypothetical protein
MILVAAKCAGCGWYSPRAAVGGEDEVLGHQNPADQQEAQRLAELPQHVDKIAPKTLAFKKLHAPISAAGDELWLPGPEITPLDR